MEDENRDYVHVDTDIRFDDNRRIFLKNWRD